MAEPTSPDSSGPTIYCVQCQAALPIDATFCLRCGTRVVRAAPSPAPTPSPAPVHQRSGTLMGVAMNAPHPAPAQQPPPAANAAPSADAAPPAAPVRRVVSAHATMMGVSGPTSGAGEPSAPAAPARPVGGTIHGVAPSGPSGPSAQQAPRTGQTMQGVVAALQPPQTSASSTGRHRRDVIMAGDPAAEARTHSPRQAPPVVSPGSATYDDEIPGVPKRGGSVFGWVFGGLLFLCVAGAGAWWYTQRPKGPATLAAVLRTRPDGQQIVSVTVPGAGANARVRHNNAEHALDAQGRAEFAVTLPAGRVGYVDVPVEVMRATGSPERRVLRFLVAWRAETDLHKLAEDPPRIHVVFHVMRGSSLWIEGQQIRVSGEVGIAELPGPAPSPAGEGDARRDTYRVRVVTPDGASIEEQYELRVPCTELQVQSPPPVLMTRDENVVVRGVAPRAARVRIGGQAATLSAGTFSAVVPLSAGSNSLDVVAYAPDGAPSLVNLTAYRDVTAETYLTTGGGDRGVAALVARPPTERARLRVTGTLVGPAIESPSGRMHQLVIENRACPAGRCTAFVALPPAATVTTGAQVEVVGEIRGSRAYSTASGERKTDPVVLAVIVTPRRS